jgi:hypothetical protein
MATGTPGLPPTVRLPGSSCQISILSKSSAPNNCNRAMKFRVMLTLTVVLLSTLPQLRAGMGGGHRAAGGLSQSLRPFSLKTFKYHIQGFEAFNQRRFVDFREIDWPLTSVRRWKLFAAFRERQCFANRPCESTRAQQVRRHSPWRRQPLQRSSFCNPARRPAKFRTGNTPARRRRSSCQAFRGLAPQSAGRAARTT